MVAGCNIRENILAPVAFLVPDPGSANNVVELGIARLPGEFADGFFRARDQHRRIAGTARMDFNGFGCPVTRRADSMTSRTLKPLPLPKLYIRGLKLQALESAACWVLPSASSAKRCASARSATWM